MGHVYRCVRLASRLSEHGIESCFCMKQNHESQSLVQSSGYTAYTLGKQESQKVILNYISKLAIDKGAVLYIDLRGPKKNLIEHARINKIPTIVYDDVFEEGIVPDTLINPTQSSNQQYEEPDVEYMLGRKYIILDTNQSKYKKDFFSATVLKLFVCFGGADPCNLTTRTVELLLRKFHGMKLMIAIGSAFQDEEKLETILAKFNMSDNITVYSGINFLAPIMSQADAAITSGGTVMCEAIDINLPVLALPTIEHEIDVIESYKQDGYVNSISRDVNFVADEELIKIIENFINNQSLRQKMYESQNEAELFTGIKDIVKSIRQYSYTN
jgi:spore coat polysaccharide biosynthesis predicted glycosyltransferase SpsG